MVRRFFVTLVVLVSVTVCSAQIINKDKMKLSNYIERLYRNSPFSGIKVIDDEENKYLISVVVLNPGKYNGDELTMTKIANVKSSSQVSKYLNGSSISSEVVIHTTETNGEETDVEVMEKIKENSIGYVKSLELLSTFVDEKQQQVYVYFKEVE